MSMGVAPGMGGRAPLPVAVKMARGTYKPGRDGPRLNVSDASEIVTPDVLRVRLPSPPAWLDDDARREYRRVGKQLVQARVMTALDGTTLAAWAHAQTKWVQLEAQVSLEGNTVRDRDGAPRLHPLLRQSNAYRQQADRLAAHLGLMPVPRQRIMAGILPETTDDVASNSPIGRLLRDRQNGPEWWDVTPPDATDAK